MIEVKLGDRARDKISGFTGIVTGKCEYLNGCVQFLLRPEKLDKDGKRIDGEWVDYQQLELINSGTYFKNEDRPGGPQDHPDGSMG
jgi:hypothetical protein